jgi:hypothetical protein
VAPRARPTRPPTSRTHARRASVTSSARAAT